MVAPCDRPDSAASARLWTPALPALWGAGGRPHRRAPAHRWRRQLFHRGIRIFGGRLVLGPDDLKAFFGNAQRAGTVVIAAPHRERAARLDLHDEAFGEEPGDGLRGGAAGQIGRPFEGAVVALRCPRQQHHLGVGKFHGILHAVDDGKCRHHRSPTVAVTPAGQDSARAKRPGRAATVALHLRGNASPFCTLHCEYAEWRRQRIVSARRSSMAGGARFNAGRYPALRG
jgi:hypothetical protein